MALRGRNSFRSICVSIPGYGFRHRSSARCRAWVWRNGSVAEEMELAWSLTYRCEAPRSCERSGDSARRQTVGQPVVAESGFADDRRGGHGPLGREQVYGLDFVNLSSVAEMGCGSSSHWRQSPRPSAGTSPAVRPREPGRFHGPLALFRRWLLRRGEAAGCSLL